MSDPVSGGNVAANSGPTRFAGLTGKQKLRIVLPLLLPIYLIIMGAHGVLQVLNAHLTATVTSTATTLTTRILNDTVLGNMRSGWVFLGIGSGLILFYGLTLLVLVVPAIRIKLSTITVLAVVIGGGFLIIPGAIVNPNAAVPTAVQAWGKQRLAITDLDDYYTIKDSVTQTFTLKNNSKKTISFKLNTREDGNYVYNTYTTITGK